MTRIRRPVALALAVLLLLCLTACGQGYETVSLRPNEYLMGEDGTGSAPEPDEPAPPEESAPPQDEPDGGVVMGEGYNNTPQLTEEDIRAMSGGEASFVYSDEGYVTFIQGRYYDKPIGDYEEAVSSLNGVASLIGLAAGSEFFGVYGEQDDDGYTYYVFQQRYGNATVQYATLRVVIDPQGYAAGLSCSFTPNLGIVEVSPTVTAQQAEDIVREAFSGAQVTYYSDSTSPVAVTLDGVTYHAYAVYTSNPDVSAANFDMMYLEHFVTYDGEYLYRLPVASLSTSNTDVYKAEDYFDGLEAEIFTGTVTLHDGSTEDITVPVAYNSVTGLYYLADVERRIMVADYYGFVYMNEFLFDTSYNNDDWNNDHLIAYRNYIQAYDFYADMGVSSVDGFGIPILVCADYCDGQGNPVDNACFFGINAGWACFATSSANDYGECLDVVGHEFTHGITSSSMCGSFYANETGAINEAYSDIMGNLCEMIMQGEEDPDWYVAEDAGGAMRCMSDPNAYEQPAFAGDVYYVPRTGSPDYMYNDNGGVHINNSLLSQVAYELHAAGMSLEDERSLWITSIELMTPLSDYDDVHAALQFSLDINGFDEDYSDYITKLFKNAGLLGDREANARAASRSGCGRLEFDTSAALAAVYVYDLSGQSVCLTWPDTGGRVSAVLPEGNYMVGIFVPDGESSLGYYYSGDGAWYTSTDYIAQVSVFAGETTTLNSPG